MWRFGEEIVNELIVVMRAAIERINCVGLWAMYDDLRAGGWLDTFLGL